MNWRVVISQFNKSSEEFYILPWIKFFNVNEFPTDNGYMSPLYGVEFGIFKIYFTLAFQKNIKCQKI